MDAKRNAQEWQKIQKVLHQALGNVATIHDRRDEKEGDVLVVGNQGHTHDEIVRFALGIKEAYPDQSVLLQLENRPDPDDLHNVAVEVGKNMSPAALLDKARYAIETAVKKNRLEKTVEIPTWLQALSVEHKKDPQGEDYALLIAKPEAIHDEAAAAAIAYKKQYSYKQIRFRLAAEKPKADVLVTAEDTAETLLVKAREVAQDNVVYEHPITIEKTDNGVLLVGRRHNDGRDFSHEAVVDAVIDYALRHPTDPVSMAFAPNDLIISVGGVTDSKALLERTREASYQVASARR